MNNRDQQPKIKSFEGIVISRDRHLAEYSEDKTKCVPTYPGPGQRPDSDFFTPANYVPPKDWLKANTALRAPQVVWLSCQTPNNRNDYYGRAIAEVRWDVRRCASVINHYFTGDYHKVGTIILPLSTEYLQHEGSLGPGFAYNNGEYDYYYRDGESSTYTVDEGDFGYHISDVVEGENKYFSTISPLKDGEEGRPYWSESKVPNPFKEIFNRLYLEVFPEVKARIEALRPGRTWVDPIDWFDEFTDWDDPDVIPNDFWGTSDKSSSDAYIPMLTSHISKYYGTDFLHIYIGSIFGIFGGAWNGDLNTVEYGTERFYVKKAYETYAGFGVILYNLPDIDYGSGFVDATDFPTNRGPGPVPDVKVGHGPDYVITDTFDHYSDPEPYNTTLGPDEVWVPEYGPWLDIEEQIAKDLVTNYNKQNHDTFKFLNDQRDDHASYIVSMANDLKDFGFVFAGNGAELSADDLVRAIADHFGFDPTTGKDL